MTPHEMWRTYIRGGWWHEPFRAIGFYQLADGDYWKNGHWTLRFWDYHTEMRRCARMPRTAATKPFSRWERIGWFISDVLDRFNAEMPRLT